MQFMTIYPGWYSSRAVHIHFKIRVPTADGHTDEFTSQLYFNDALTDRIHTQEPVPGAPWPTSPQFARHDFPRRQRSARAAGR